MISRTIVFFITILIVVVLGEALVCHTCIASSTSNCHDGVVHSYIIQPCEVQSHQNFSVLPDLAIPSTINRPYSREEPIKTVCVRLEYELISSVYVRGCGYIWESVDICEYLEELLDVKGCSYCEADFCNELPGTI